MKTPPEQLFLEYSDTAPITTFTNFNGDQDIKEILIDEITAKIVYIEYDAPHTLCHTVLVYCCTNPNADHAPGGPGCQAVPDLHVICGNGGGPNGVEIPSNSNGSLPVSSSYGGPSSSPTPIITSPISPCNGCLPISNFETKDPCIVIKKLQTDANFKLRMSGMLEKARQWSFEQVETMYDAAIPTAANNFTYSAFNGNANQSEAKYDYFTNIKGHLHMYYGSLLSIFSAEDLYNYYLMIKNPAISEDLFWGLATNQNTAYLMLLNNKDAFIAFGDTYFKDEDSFKRFMTKMNRDYGISTDKSNDYNEKAFLKMMRDLNTGITLASTAEFNASTPVSADIFNTWTKKTYNPSTRNVESSNCN